MKKIHRSWAVCLGCTLALLVCTGLLVNAFSVTQPYILRENGFTNTQTSTIITIRSVTNLLCMFIVPFFYRKLGYRLGLALSTLLGAAANIVFALAKSLAAYYAAGAIAGLCYGLGCMIPVTILLSRWYVEKRGLALGFCAAGTGLATVVFSPVLTWLIESFGLRVCFFAQAILCALIALLVFLLVRNSPEELGLCPYGTTAEQVKKPAGTDVEFSRLRWIMIYAALTLISACTSVGFTHLSIHLTTVGFAPMIAGSAVSLFGFMLMMGKCVMGVVCDRCGGYRANYLFGTLMVLGIVLCIFARADSAVLMYAAAMLYGFGCPLSTVGISIWAGDFSNEKTYAMRVQRMQFCYALGTLLFATMPGMIADRFGSYVLAYVIFLAFCVFAIITVQSSYLLIAREQGQQRRGLRRRRRERPQESAFRRSLKSLWQRIKSRRVRRRH